MNRTPLDECFRVAGRTTWHIEVAEIQRDPDWFLAYYDPQCSHQGYRLRGRTPVQALREALGADQLPPLNEMETITDNAATWPRRSGVGELLDLYTLVDRVSPHIVIKLYLDALNTTHSDHRASAPAALIPYYPNYSRQNLLIQRTRVSTEYHGPKRIHTIVTARSDQQLHHLVRTQRILSSNSLHPIASNPHSYPYKNLVVSSRLHLNRTHTRITWLLVTPGVAIGLSFTTRQKDQHQCPPYALR